MTGQLALFPTAALELQQIDTARRRRRRYHLAPCLSLFGDPGLLITWGSMGKRPRLRLETFSSTDDQHTRWQTLLARRVAHGYRIQSQS
jgi:predicted DNA-binding WGR domain protein